MLCKIYVRNGRLKWRFTDMPGSAPRISRWPGSWPAAGRRLYENLHEKVSGKGRDRPQLDRLLKGLAEGDVLIITRLDRLARSTRTFST